jgi:uncharacterized protein YdeI (YjbR/CyaY-like superfamily)
MNPKVDAFLKKTKTWREEFETLREIILTFPLTEELKWAKPCYTFQDSNVLIIQGFKEYCALMFCKGALLKDTKGLLIKPGENTQAARQLRFTSAKEITKLAPTIKSYIREAMDAQEAGLEVQYKETSEFPVPDELTKALAKNAKLKAAFEALTPGRQRGYLLHFAAAKQSKTRESRIEKCAPLILKGKGLQDRE